MANAIVALISVAIVLAGVALTSQASFKSMDVLADAWKQMEVRSGDIARTRLEVLSTYHSGSRVDVTLANPGQTSLRDFEKWDVVVEYYDNSDTYYQVWLTHTSVQPPESNRWSVTGIYVVASSQPEVFQPDIFDPSEEMVIRFNLVPPPKSAVTHRVVIGTPNGVTVSSMF